MSQCVVIVIVDPGEPSSGPTVSTLVMSNVPVLALAGGLACAQGPMVMVRVGMRHQISVVAQLSIRAVAVGFALMMEPF